MLDREPEPHYGKAAWMAVRTGQANERTDRGLAVREVNKGYQSERERGVPSSTLTTPLAP